jgi:hypothetical protein
MECYIDNYVRLRSCIGNINKAGGPVQEVEGRCSKVEGRQGHP